MSESQRNFLILAAITVVAVAATGAFGIVTISAFTLINWAFIVLGVLAYVQFRRRNTTTISSMPVRDRLLFEGGIIGIVAIWVTGRMVPGWAVGRGAGASVLFIAALAACGYAIYVGWTNRPNRW